MIYIIGAGISGLTTADNLDKDFTIIEKNGYPGGLSTQYKSGGHWFDFSGHYFHFSDKEDIKKYVETFSEFREYKRDSRTYMFGRMIPFPVQYHLSYFPENTGQKILSEMKNGPGHKSENLEESLTGKFGATLYNLFFKPFMMKYYRRSLSGIIPAMDRGSIPVPDIRSVEEGLSGKNFKDTGYNPLFYYPSGGLRTFIGKMEEKISGKIKYSEVVKEIDLKGMKLTTDKGEYKFSRIVNTMPLNDLMKVLGPSPEWRDYGERLESVSTLVVNLILRERREDFHWVYLPEPFTGFYRAGYYPAHPDIACYLERSLKEGERYDADEVREGVISVLKKLNMIFSEDEILHFNIKVIPGSYIIFNDQWKRTVPGLIDDLKSHGVYSIGRYGSWNYSSMSDDIKSGITTAEMLNGVL
ncbi:MAG: NAD(P)-binding protein [Acidobacteriota bacterium]